MNKQIHILTLLFTGLVALGQDDYVSMIMPDNVNLGMTLSNFNNARPVARELPWLSRSERFGTHVKSFSELFRDATPPYTYQYNFVSNQLCSITKGYAYFGNSEIPLAKVIQTSLSNGLMKSSEEKALRLSRKTMQPIMIPVEAWTNKNSNIGVYFINTTDELSIITFDRRYFEKKDFFLGEEDVGKVMRTVNEARSFTPSLSTTNR